MCIQLVQEPALASRCEGDGVFPQTFASPLHSCMRTIASWIARSAQRRALRELAQEGRLLRDIGLTREQALREAEKLFWRP